MGAFEKALDAVKGSLGQDEDLIHYVPATRVENGNSGSERGVLAVTNQRIIYRGTFLFGTGTNLEWRLGQINGIAATKSMLFEHVEINGGGAVVKFLTQYGLAKGFVQKANSALAASRPSSTAPSQDSQLAGELAKLAELFSKGLLTEEEFIAAKQKLIS